MEQKTRSHSGSLLLELMLAILIFALSASVCVQVFVKAHQMSAQAQALSQSVRHCSSAGEILRQAPSREEGLQLLKQCYPQLEIGPASAQADLEGQTIQIHWTQKDGLVCYTIACQDPGGSQIYSLEVLALEEVQP